MGIFLKGGLTIGIFGVIILYINTSGFSAIVHINREFGGSEIYKIKQEYEEKEIK